MREFTNVEEKLQEATRMIRRESKHSVPFHRIEFELAAEPDQYRITYDRPLDSKRYSLVPRITLTKEEFAEWQNWLISR